MKSLSEKTELRMYNKRRELLQKYGPWTEQGEFINETAYLFLEIRRLRDLLNLKKESEK